MYLFTYSVCVYYFFTDWLFITALPLSAEFNIGSEEGIDSSDSLMEAFTPELK